MNSRLLSIFLIPFFALLFFACSKSHKAKPTSPADSSYTSHMGGLRNWHRSHYYTASGVHYPTPIYESYFLSDTTFALTIIDDSTIDIWGNAFQFDRIDSIKKMCFFGTAYNYYQNSSGYGIIYYYDKDSIVYCICYIHGAGDFSKLQDLTYTY